MTMSFVNGKTTDADSTTNNQDDAPNKITQEVSYDVCSSTSSQKKQQQEKVASTKTTSNSVRDKVALWERLGRRCSNNASVAPLNTHHHHQQNHQHDWKQIQDRPGRPTTPKSKSLSSLHTKSYTTTSIKGSYADSYLKLLGSEQNNSTNNNNLSNSDNNTNFINSGSRFQLTKDLTHESLRSIGSDDDEDDYHNSNNKSRIPIFRSGSTTSDDDDGDYSNGDIDGDGEGGDDDEFDCYYNSKEVDDGCLQLVLTDDKKLTYSHSWSHSNKTANAPLFEREDDFAKLINQICMTTVQNTAPLTSSLPSSSSSSDKKIKQKDRGHVRSTLSFVMSSFRNTKKQAAKRRHTKDDVNKAEENLVDGRPDNSSTNEKKKKKKKDINNKKKKLLSAVLPITTPITTPVVVRSNDKVTDIATSNNNKTTNSRSRRTEHDKDRRSTRIVEWAVGIYNSYVRRRWRPTIV
mmetsp:Transcript_51122/g.123413  ORF Transcript_51122/g.123413 Transcript_51122/m.123413 type:complete len:462 (+) Transcript_51122:542-1927(+)